jgi:hypothetical protein
MFSYAQARLQARHGARPGGTDWLRLEGAGDLANYLLIAQQSTMKPWILGLHAHSSSHEIELTLREQFRQHVGEVARWVPSDWKSAMQWVSRIVDLPVISHLLAGEMAPAWVSDDPVLQGFAIGELDLRRGVEGDPGLTALIDQWQPDVTIFDGWLMCWQLLWPKQSHHRTGLDYLSRLFKTQIEAQSSETAVDVAALRERLDHDLVTAFRRYRAQPAAAFAHIALTALDLERLRGGLVRRALFPEQVSNQPS